MRLRIALLLGLLCLSVSADASEWVWESLTSMRQINVMTRDESMIWCGTEGGLFSLNLSSGAQQLYTNIQGLHSNEITAISLDNKGKTWIGLDNGLLQVFTPETNLWETISDYEGRQINTLYAFSDTLLVGLDIGLSMYNMQKMEVRETYKQLGQGIQVETPVVDVAVKGKTLWVATKEGISLTNLNYVNLLDPVNWTVFSHTAEYNLEDATSLQSWNNQIYAGSSHGLYVYNGSRWLQERAEGIVSVQGTTNGLYVCTRNSIFYLQEGKWITVEPSLSKLKNLQYTDNTLLAGTEKGLFLLNENNKNWQDITPNGLYSNLITDVHVDRSGTVWVGSRQDGFFYFENEQWHYFSADDIPGTKTYEYFDIHEAMDGSLWFGTWGGGVKKYTPSTNTWEAFAPENNYLAGIDGYPDYCVVHHIAEDETGTLWFVNREAVNNRGLAAMSEGEWTYYGINDGVKTKFLSDVTVDIYGRVWLGSDPLEPSGVFVLDPARTPHDKSDDLTASQITVNDGLESNHITALDADEDGGVWIGSPEGLYYFYNGFIERQFGLLSEYVNDVHVDGVGNVWVGTNKGLALLSANQYEWLYFTMENSLLVSDDIVSIASDDENGFIYVCTSQGISKISTPFARPVEQLSSIRIYPNPFNLKKQSTVTIDDIASNVSLDIFNSAGYLVRHFSNHDVVGRRVLWDGKNESGKTAASGIYLVVIYQEDGKKETGKLVLIQ